MSALTRELRMDHLAAAVDDFTESMAESGSVSAVQVLERAARAVLGVVPADVWCTVLLDPSTLLDTGGHHEHGFPDSAMPRLFEIEHIEHEGVDNLRRLAERGTTASALSISTGGELGSSVYYRDILRPLKLADELRVVLRTGKRIWGVVVLCRGGSVGFSRDDVAVAEAVAEPAGAAVCRSLRVNGLDPGDVPDLPGVLVLDGDYQTVSSSVTVERWLADLRHDGEDRARLPNAVRALAMRTRAARPFEQVRSRAQTRSSRWATLESWVIDGRHGEQVVVSIGPAGPQDLAAIILDTYNVTARQREVMQYLLRGDKAAAIARRLGVEENTIHKHTNAVYRATGTSSRAEFTWKLLGEYVSRHGAGPLTTDGRLVDQTRVRPR